jgi:hypothetical protein
MAEKLYKSVNGLEVDLSHTVYQYVKALLNRDYEEEKIEKVGNWRNICQWLEEEGYKYQQTTQPQSNQPVPVNAQIKIENTSIENISIENISIENQNISIENQTFKMDIKMDIGVLIQFVVPLPPDYPKEEPPQ